ncbi:19925_t:CDS:2 [Funneliformis geosporum]|uniref:14505_t:CDS:1 n=1 Tax=Funneliformis geosporum TaxID=1117311 RepID=A0A9W4SKK8_9GLOM|nr:14505_t:CDS:2 [Funneliformis geosporum]CAI2185403.1 19925_t:CDS:2 [Funneliformis geosporum]
MSEDNTITKFSYLFAQNNKKRDDGIEENEQIFETSTLDELDDGDKTCLPEIKKVSSLDEIEPCLPEIKEIKKKVSGLDKDKTYLPEIKKNISGFDKKKSILSRLKLFFN